VLEIDQERSQSCGAAQNGTASLLFSFADAAPASRNRSRAVQFGGSELKKEIPFKDRNRDSHGTSYRRQRGIDGQIGILGDRRDGKFGLNVPGAWARPLLCEWGGRKTREYRYLIRMSMSVKGYSGSEACVRGARRAGGPVR
jgi:hypothetical protein